MRIFRAIFLFCLKILPAYFGILKKNYCGLRMGSDRLFRLRRFLRHYKKQVIFGPIFKLIEAVFELIVPLVMAQIIDVGIDRGDTAYVWKMGGVLLVLGITGLISALICQYLASVASQGFGTELRNALFSHINSLSHHEIDKFGTPSLITRMTNDINQLQYAVAMLIRLVIRAPFLAIGAVIMAMSIDLKLSLIFLVATPLIVAVLYFIMSRSVPLYRVIQKKLDKISLISRENLEGNRVIRAFSKQKQEEKRFEDASEDLAKTAIRVGKISALLNPATFLIMNFAILAIVWFGGVRVNLGDMTSGQIVAFVNYMTQILLALVVVANLVVTFTKAAASGARVNEVFDMKSSIVEQKDAAPIQKDETAPAVSFENVSFSYDGSDRYALHDIHFHIERGQTVGIIGGTGAGKSTLVNLIPRFYDTTKGCVRVFGHDVRDYSFSQLRGMIGMVPQRAVLFSGTVRENMQWGKKDADDDEIAWALSIAQASEFVDKLPQKYDTLINQGGKNLSGGQKQRLTIARALVRRPEILILDDSASALDFATDASLRRAIAQNTQGMTVLLISQRASTIRRADQIIVLDDGGICGVGTHEELIQDCEVYREICLSQLSSEEVSQ